MDYPIVFLEWRDACYESADEGGGVDSGLVPLREVGFLVGESDESITIAMELDQNGNPSRFRLHIPKVMIVRRTVLKIPTRKRK